jgi:hypothetical protein
MSLTKEDVQRIMAEALRGGVKPKFVRVTGTVKLPGPVQYSMKHLSFTVEEEIPQGKTRREVVDEICKDLGPLVAQYTHVPDAPNLPKTNEPTQELDPAYLDGLGWKQFASGKGEWIFADAPGAKALAEEVAKQGSLEIGKHRYRITQGRDRAFINRHPVEQK